MLQSGEEFSRQVEKLLHLHKNNLQHYDWSTPAIQFSLEIDPSHLNYLLSRVNHPTTPTNNNLSLEAMKESFKSLSSLTISSIIDANLENNDENDDSLLNVDLTNMFPSLKYLAVRKVPLSSISGLFDQMKTLEVLCCQCNIVSFHQFTDIFQIQGTIWRNLRVLDLSRNCITDNDARFLGCFKSLEYLNLASNCLQQFPLGLELLPNLTTLNLAHNSITTLQGLDNVPFVLSMSLRGNRIDSLQGLEKFSTLRKLDISKNLIWDLKEFEILSSTCIDSLWIDGNPLCYKKGLKYFMWSILSTEQKKNFKLDGKKFSFFEKLLFPTKAPLDLPLRQTLSWVSINEDSAAFMIRNNPAERDADLMSIARSERDKMKDYEKELLKSLGEDHGNEEDFAEKEEDLADVVSMATSQQEHIEESNQQSKEEKKARPRKSKKKVVRMAPLDSEGNVGNVELSTSSSPKKNEVGHFRKRIEAMRNEGGTSWLKVYSEIQKDGSEPKLVESTIEKSPELKSIRCSPPTLPIAAKKPQEDAIELSLPSLSFKKEVDSQQKPSNEALQGKAFYVDLMIAKQKLKSRILIASESILFEMDTITGKLMESRPLSYLAKTEKNSAQSIVSLEFRFSKKDSLKVEYKMENNEAVEELQEILKQVVETNRKLGLIDKFIPKWKCVSCSSIFNSLPAMNYKCTKCKGNLVEFYASEDLGSLSKKSSATSLKEKGLVSFQAFPTASTFSEHVMNRLTEISNSLLLHIKLSIFEQEAERFLLWIPSQVIEHQDFFDSQNYSTYYTSMIPQSLTRNVPFRMLPRRDERKVRQMFILMSNYRIYLLEYCGKLLADVPEWLREYSYLYSALNDPENEVKQIYSLRYDQIKRVDISSNRQSFCIHLEDFSIGTSVYSLSFLTRDQDLTSAFVDCIIEIFDEAFSMNPAEIKKLVNQDPEWQREALSKVYSSFCLQNQLAFHAEEILTFKYYLIHTKSSVDFESKSVFMLRKCIVVCKEFHDQIPSYEKTEGRHLDLDTVLLYENMVSYRKTESIAKKSLKADNNLEFYGLNLQCKDNVSIKCAFISHSTFLDFIGELQRVAPHLQEEFN